VAGNPARRTGLATMRVLLLGATGVAGRRAASELVRSERADAVTFAATTTSKVENLAAFLGGRNGRVSARTVDATDPRVMTAAAGDHDVVASCAGPAYDTEAHVVRACIDAGTPYVSLCDDHASAAAAFALGKRAEEAGVTIVSGCGLSPGITNLLVALAADGLDGVEEIEIAVAYSLTDSGGGSLLSQLLHGLGDSDAPYVSEYRRVAGRAGELPRPVYFPEPVGWVETFTSGHPEGITAPRVYSDLRAMRFRLGVTERAVMDLLRATTAMQGDRSDRHEARWERFTRAAVPVLRALPPRGASWSAARVDVRGTREGRPEGAALGVVDHIMNLASLPLVHAALEIGSGSVTRPGVHSIEEVFDAKPFLGALGRRGLRAARLTSEIFESR
jgi:lysine 6-dehydrogenase